MKTFSNVVLFLVTAFWAIDGLAQIWDRPPMPGGRAFVDQVFPDFPEFSTYLVTNVGLMSKNKSGDISIGSVTTYFTDDANNSGNPGLFTAVDSAILNIFPDDGQLDTEDPAAGMVVPVTIADSDGDGILECTAADLGITIEEGFYWIGLTPIAEFSTFEQEFHYESFGVFFQESQIRNPGGGFGFNAGTQWTAVSDELDPGNPFEASLTLRKPVSQTVASSIEIFRGILNGGTLADTFQSDDVRMRFNPGLTLNSNEAPVWLIFDGFLPEFATLRNFTLESQAGTPGLTTTIEAFNWTTAAYDVINVSDAQFNNDAVITVDLGNDYVSDPDVRVRIGWRKTGLTINFPWEVRIDRLVWESK